MKNLKRMLTAALCMAAACIIAQAQDYPEPGIYKLQNMMTGTYAKTQDQKTYLGTSSFADAQQFRISYTTSEVGHPVLTEITEVESEFNLIENIQAEFFGTKGIGTAAIKALTGRPYYYDAEETSVFIHKLLDLRLVPTDAAGTTWCVASQMPTEMTDNETAIFNSLKQVSKVYSNAHLNEVISKGAGEITAYVSPWGNSKYFSRIFNSELTNEESVDAAQWPASKPRSIVSFYLRPTTYTEPIVTISETYCYRVQNIDNGMYLSVDESESTFSETSKDKSSIVVLTATEMLKQVATWRTACENAIATSEVSEEAKRTYLDRLLTLHVEPAIDNDDAVQFYFEQIWQNATAEEETLRQQIATQCATEVPFAQWMSGETAIIDDVCDYPCHIYLAPDADGNIDFSINRASATTLFAITITDVPTCISNPNISNANTPVFAIDGTRVNSNRAGLQVRNGKKIVVK